METNRVKIPVAMPFLCRHDVYSSNSRLRAWPSSPQVLVFFRFNLNNFSFLVRSIYCPSAAKEQKQFHSDLLQISLRIVSLCVCSCVFFFFNLNIYMYILVRVAAEYQFLRAGMNDSSLRLPERNC